MKHDWRRRGAINDTHSPMVTGQIIYSWLLIRHVLYISMIYLSLLIHILAATRIHIKKGKSKKHLPTSLFVWNAFVYRAFHEGGVWQRGHSTPHLTPPSFYSASTLWWRRKNEGKSDLLSEVLSEVFGKHLTLWTSSKQRRFGRESEVGRSFLKFSSKIRMLYPQGHLLSYGVYAYKKKEVCCNY